MAQKSLLRDAIRKKIIKKKSSSTVNYCLFKFILTGSNVDSNIKSSNHNFCNFFSCIGTSMCLACKMHNEA